MSTDTKTKWHLTLGLCVLAIIVFFVSGCGEAVPAENFFTAPPGTAEVPAMTEEALAFIGDDFIVRPGFVSHLPIVVVDFTVSELFVFDNAGSGISGNNSLSDTAAFRSPAAVRPETAFPVEHEKGRFLITLTGADGAERESPLLGMAGGSEWALLGSSKDKSLMRDYLAFSISRAVAPETPDCRFCELVFRTEAGDFYRGVYLLAESAVRKIMSGDFSTGGNEKKPRGFIVTQDRKNNKGIPLDTWGSREGFVDGQFSLLFPKRAVSDEALSFITENLEEMEKALYSENHKKFSAYSGVIDTDSFTDYFILSEYLQNYGAGFDSACMYKDARGKIRMGPIWNSSGILGNDFSAPLNSGGISAQNEPFFERLTLDAAFLNRLAVRYSALRRGVLDDTVIIRLIDETAKYLGPARFRDWKRWSWEYVGAGPQNNSDNFLPDETTDSFEKELIKMKYLAVRHAAVIGDSIHRMTWREDLFDTSYNTKWSMLFILLYVLIYLLAVRFGRHH